MRRVSKSFLLSRRPAFIPLKRDKSGRPIFSNRQILAADKIKVGQTLRLHSAGRKTRTAVVLRVSADVVDLYLVEEKYTEPWYLSGLSVIREGDSGWDRYHYLTRTDKPILTESELADLY